MSSKASPSPAPDAPRPELGQGRTIGVYDSGVGGLSVLRALLTELPLARFVYAADGAFAPYGEKPRDTVTERVLGISATLRWHHRADMLVLACNTATALSVDRLRAEHPGWPVVGVEPALRPAALRSRSGCIGVMATRGTVESERFAQLQARVIRDAGGPLRVRAQACDGLVDAIERQDTARVHQLCARYASALTEPDGGAGELDTLVLGCTHYPFVADVLQDLVGPKVTLVESGPAVARRTREVLPPPGSNTVEADTRPAGPLLLCTAAPQRLAAAAQRWLGLRATSGRLDIH